MFCPKCGNRIETPTRFCSKCGNQLIFTQTPIVQNNVVEQKNENLKFVLIGSACGVLFLVIFTLALFLTRGNENKYYFSNDTYGSNEVENSETPNENTSTNSVKRKGKYGTAIVYDTTLHGVTVGNKSDALKLISDESVSQKSNCPSEIKNIEDKIISKYGITAVNLCEMDLDFANEIEKVLDNIYSKYPSIKGNLTNITLVTNGPNSYIAAFMPRFTFAYSVDRGYPWVNKTQIILNTSYFFNQDLMEGAISSSTKSGHFPPNTTKYSPVAHEFGHYLSYLALLKHHDLDTFLIEDSSTQKKIYNAYLDFAYGDFSLKMIEEAFSNYNKDHPTTMTRDEWRATISNYAVAKDENGKYIYDETIAEAFHDIYLNKENAKPASKYVIAVLEKYLEK